MKDNFRHDVLGAIERLDSWIEKNSWRGWDPFDIRGLPIFLKIARLPQSFPYSYAKGIVFNQPRCTFHGFNQILFFPCCLK